ncbi:hypothetical protein ACIGKR_31015 [Rhodococcus qingshengii]
MSPSDEMVAALADYFGVSPGYFFTIPWSGIATKLRITPPMHSYILF